MKKLNYILSITLICIIFSTSCTSVKNKEYPNYTLTKIDVIPDSLKTKHSVWITETVRAASQHMSAGDYEDVPQTIRQATWSADDLFSIEILCLRKEFDDDYYHDIIIKPNEFNNFEKQIFDSLTFKK